MKATKSEKYTRSHETSNKHLIAFFGRYLSITEITKPRAQEFMIELITKVPKGWSTYVRNYNALFNYAVEYEFIERNPFHKLRLPKTQKKYPAYVNKEQLESIVKEINNETINDLVIATFYTGLRLAEVTNLKWRNVDWDNGFIKIGDSSFTTKTAETRIIPICESLKELLKNLFESNINNSEYVFTKENGYPFSSDYVSHTFTKAVKKSGSDPEIHFHSLRHSTASQLAKMNISPTHIQKILGHKNQKTTEIYLHLQADDLKKAMGMLDTL